MALAVYIRNQPHMFIVNC